VEDRQECAQSDLSYISAESCAGKEGELAEWMTDVFWNATGFARKSKHGDIS
jgi:hypothetical protein